MSRIKGRGPRISHKIRSATNDAKDSARVYPESKPYETYLTCVIPVPWTDILLLPSEELSDGCLSTVLAVGFSETRQTTNRMDSNYAPNISKVVFDDPPPPLNKVPLNLGEVLACCGAI